MIHPCLSLLLCFGFVVAQTAVRAAEPLTFEQHVRPILKTYCLDCHGAEEKLRGGLDLRLKRFAEKGGKKGAAVVAREPAKSLILQRLKAGEMPPGEKKLSAAQIAVIEKWIVQGAITRREEPAQLPPGIDITPEERAYWFYQPIKSQSPPTFTSADRVRTPIDGFVLAKLRDKGLSFAPEAEGLTLLRRAAFDLTGLPPSEQDIAQFLAEWNATSQAAFENAIDRLLASPHYGERWGRHWLDVAGYADSDGNGGDDTPRPYSYKYRDYVIRSLNADKPLDQFLIEQLAGDELVAPPWKNPTPDQIEKLTATGFLRMAPDGASGGGDVVPAANQTVADTLKIVGSSLLGLTVGCAQCHDHKYDPIPQSDYFRLRAVFEPALDPQHWRRPPQRLVSLYTDEDRAKAAAVEAEVQKLQAEYNTKQEQYLTTALEKELQKFPEDQRGSLRDAYRTPAVKRTAEQKKLLAANPSVNLTPGVLYQYNQQAADELKKDQARIAVKRAEKPVEDFVSVLNEVAGQVPATHVFYRGDYRQPQQAVKPGDLTIAAPDGGRLEIADKDAVLPTTGRRLAWAKHLVSGKHPLLGRVLANRIWLNHFGRGLVDTPGDFGQLGTRPTHPELLDWLAAELPRQGWSLKRMHKVIMTSSVYRQSSVQQPGPTTMDTDGSLYSRYAIRRLDAETLRDRMLATTGTLDRTPFGPSAPVAEDTVGQVVVKDDVPRRGIYLQARRTKPVSFLAAFDAPLMAVNCDKRSSSTVAPQALMLMNSDFILKQAGLFATRLRKEAPASFDDQAALAWRLAYQRSIAPEELALARRFVERQRDQLRASVGADKADQAALTNLCQQLLGSNEFLYGD